MGLVHKVKQSVRHLLDSPYCKNLPSKKNIGSSTADNWFILTDNLKKDSIVYSGGVGKDIFFELALARDFGCTILLFDPSPTGVNTISKTSLPSNISFFPKGLAAKDGYVSFDEPVNALEGSYRIGTSSGTSFECRSLSSLFKENGHTSIELLKIDIEGFEYEVLDDVMSSGADIRQIVVEFHDFYKDISKESTAKTIRHLKANKYEIFHKRGHDYSFVKVS